MSTQMKTEEEFNPYLSGNYAPVMDEHVWEDMEVIGEIPKDISGNFLRIGPNPVYVPDVATYHIFDGDGMIHGVEIKDGKATYRNKFVDTEGLRLEREKGTWIWKGMASMADMVKGVAPPEEGMMKNTANTAMVYHNKTLYALMEAAPPHEMKLPSLETVGEHDFNGKLTHPFTAHPKVDAVTGEMITFGYSPMPPYLTYSVINPEGEIVHTAPITMPKGIMMHDCAITENHTIFLDTPITFDFQRAMEGGLMLDWEPENGTRLGVVPRMGSDEDVKWFDVDTSMCFHVANAWEEGDEIVVQASRSLKSNVASATENAREGVVDPDEMGKLYEWRLNMKTGESSERYLNDVHHCDFTRINDDLMGRKTRYIYASRFDLDNGAKFNAELKYDNESETVQVHELGAGRWGGEGVFAKRHGATAEDDGYVVLFVWDENEQQSECVIIDAQNFEADPVARIKIPSRVPFGFHAGWAPDA
ncbi:MAG: carotenoid oxygenase family protein [Alphaproteobacteria bacterium]